MSYIRNAVERGGLPFAIYDELQEKADSLRRAIQTAKAQTAEVDAMLESDTCPEFVPVTHLLAMERHSDEFAEVCERAQKAMAAQAPEGLVTIQEYARVNGVRVRTV